MRIRLGVLASWASIVALPLALVSIWLTIVFRDSKLLQLELVDRISLLQPGMAQALNVTIPFNGKAVQNLGRMRFRLVNIGDPIAGGDVEHPVTLDFGEQGVLAANITSLLPADLRRARANSASSLIDVEGSRVLVRHGLLNSGDAIEFEVLVGNDPVWPEVFARIHGVQAVSVIDRAIDGRTSEQTVLHSAPYLIGLLAAISVTIVPAGSLALLWATARHLYRRATIARRRRTGLPRRPGRAMRALNPRRVELGHLELCDSLEEFCAQRPNRNGPSIRLSRLADAEAMRAFVEAESERLRAEHPSVTWLSDPNEVSRRLEKFARVLVLSIARSAAGAWDADFVDRWVDQHPEWSSQAPSQLAEALARDLDDWLDVAGFPVNPVVTLVAALSFAVLTVVSSLAAWSVWQITNMTPVQ